MNFYWLALLGLYLSIGTFVCSFARDKNDKPMPIHHFIFIVWFWPVLFLLGRDG